MFEREVISPACSPQKAAGLMLAQGGAVFCVVWLASAFVLVGVALIRYGAAGLCIGFGTWLLTGWLPAHVIGSWMERRCARLLGYTRKQLWPHAKAARLRNFRA